MFIFLYVHIYLIFLLALIGAQMTPLHLACQSGHVDVVEFLIDNKASLSARVSGTDNFNCLDLAVVNGHLNVCLTIINHSRWEEALQSQDNIRMKRMVRFLPVAAKAVLDVSRFLCVLFILFVFGLFARVYVCA